jgi:uncharacterized membrane protein
LVIGGFALLFFVVGSFVSERILAKMEAAPAEPGKKGGVELPGFLRLTGKLEHIRAQVPAFAAILPFLLLTMAAVRLPLNDPSPLYGLALLLAVLALGVAKVTMVDVLVPVSLVSVLALEYSWHKTHFSPDVPGAPLLWNLAFAALLTAFPFPFRRAYMDRSIPWATAALAGPLHFYLIHQVVKRGYPNEFMGTLPAALALPMIMGLVFVARNFPLDHAKRTGLLAWFGASALFFVTLVFPIQFDRQWITIGWALEGAALLWLFHRLPHRGLPVVGIILLVVAFIRLTFNPAVYHYYERSDVRIFNWFLYAYGIVIVCLMAGGKLLAAPRNKVLGVSAPPLLYTLGTVLMFWLLNLEIADYFSEGRHVTFRLYGGSLGQNTTYSIAWAIFALAMLVVGVWKQLRPVRYAALALLGITLGKLILYDFARLQALYRVAAFLGVAVISVLASVLYQRFFANLTRSDPPINRR